tara:strand:- start:846 stop:1406 length:561 start_codon:yes stop_codon:yes gene_type:complete
MSNQTLNSIKDLNQANSYLCKVEDDVVIGNSIYSRNVPSQPLAPQFSMRPVPTKYSHFPIVDPRPPAQLVSIEPLPTYNVEKVFNPGNAQAPWSGFATNIDKESTLRNQFFALQRCQQRYYVPSTASDMYDSVIPVTDNVQTHPLLFNTENFKKFNTNPYDTSKEVFNNHTRQDVKNIKCSNIQRK